MSQETIHQKQDSENDSELWQRLFKSEINFIQMRKDFLTNCTERVALIQKALHNPAQRGTALRLLEYLKVEERQLLFDDLLALASVSHSGIILCRQAILSLPQEWLLANIEKSSQPLLSEGTYEEYRRLLELYMEIDWELTHRLATLALQNDDLDIRETGEDFIEILQEDRPST